MDLIDWRALYASNRAAIEQATGKAGTAATLPSPSGLGTKLDRPPTSPGPATSLASVLPAGLPTSVPNLSAPLSSRLPEALGTSLPPAVRMPPLRGRVRSAAGSEGGALVHLPAGVERGTAVPLLCMLHGCTQDPHSFAAATRMNEAADRHGFAVVYPRQEADGNPQRCWNWFLPEHQERGGGEAGAIARVVERLAAGGAGQAIDGRRVFVAGLSSGGAMAAILAFTHPELFAAVAVHSGLAYGAALSMPAAFAAMARGGEDPTLLGPAAHAAMGERARGIPGMVIHGDADATVAPVNAGQILGQLMHANRLADPDGPAFHPDRPSERVRGSVAGGHGYTRSRWLDERGTPVHERLIVHGMGHAWSGGPAGGSYTDPRGPDATEGIWRFFDAAVPAG
jgi:poly(hydroxyalkanoate) depolymerase family esterase